MKKVKIKDAGIPTGFTFSATIQPGQEVDTGFNETGIYFINIFGSGHSALYFHNGFIPSSDIISGPSSTYSITDTPDRMCFFRKTNSGSIYLKNNASTTRTVRIKSITIPIAN